METLKTLFRTLARNKVLTGINLFGLALGISGCLLIVLYVTDELGFDSHHANIDRIFRINTKFVSEGSVDHIAISPVPLPDEVRKFPEVEKAVRFIQHDAEETVKNGNIAFQEKYLFEGDADIFDVFSYKLLSGSPETALAQPRSVVLTASAAKKYFGEDDPMGKTLTIGKDDHQVTGIMEDLPLNSDLRFTVISSLDTTDNLDDWFDLSYYNYVMFNEKSLTAPDFISTFEKKLQKVCDDKINAVIWKEDKSMAASFDLQPVKGMHFAKSLQYDTPKGNKSYVIIFSVTAMLLLIIACLNYINFSMVQSIERSKEVAVRKISGAGRRHLVGRFIGQSVALTSLSVVVAVGIVALLMPFFNEVTSKNFAIADLFHFQVVAAVAGMVLFVGVLAGSYPAFYTSSINVVSALKGRLATPRGQVIRKISITTQFMISSGLVICTAVAYHQMTFIRNYDLGFRKNNVVAVATPVDSLNFEKQRTFAKRLKGLSGIDQVSLTSALPSEVTGRGSISIKANGPDEIRMVNYAHIDANFIPALQIKLKAGRNFETESVSDYNNSVMINEAFARMMNWKNPLDEKVKWKGTYRNVIGIVSDYHYLSLHNKVDPLLFVLHENNISDVIVALNPGNVKDQLALIRGEWEATFPGVEFVYKFLDDSVGAQYQREETAMTVFSYFSVLTIIISCLGLFGLSSLSVYQRKREIGIRKAIGASFRSLIVLFSKEYMTLILVSMALVAPVCWYLTDYWLKEFLFKIDAALPLYVVAGIGIVLISLVTIVLSIARISNSKPSDLIRE